MLALRKGCQPSFTHRKNFYRGENELNVASARHFWASFRQRVKGALILCITLLSFKKKSLAALSAIKDWLLSSYKKDLSVNFIHHGKNGFVTARELGTTNEFFVASTKHFAAATKRFVERTKHFVVVTKCFCYPYFNKWFCWYNKPFFPWVIFWDISMNTHINWELAMRPFFWFINIFSIITKLRFPPVLRSCPDYLKHVFLFIVIRWL